jgi:phosphoribosylformylglycinamidine (FGAM) synthase-like amidotransferase family enzyme
MPHVEHASDELTGSTDGLRLFGSLARHLSAVTA